MHIGYISEQSVNNPFYYEIVNDTLSQYRLMKKEKGMYVGGGFEVQRNFYKKIYLYASADLRLGYTQGNFAERIELKTNNSNVNQTISINDYTLPNYKSSSYRLEMIPNIGVKLNLKKINFAIESGINIRNMYMIEHTNKINNLYVFDILGMRNRIVLMYKL